MFYRRRRTEGRCVVSSSGQEVGFLFNLLRAANANASQIVGDPLLLLLQKKKRLFPRLSSGIALRWPPCLPIDTHQSCSCLPIVYMRIHDDDHGVQKRASYRAHHISKPAMSLPLDNFWPIRRMNTMPHLGKGLSLHAYCATYRFRSFLDLAGSSSG